MLSVFDSFTPYTGPAEPDYMIDFLGIRTSNKFIAGMSFPQSGIISPSLPIADEELFEWIDLLTAIDRARAHMFVMMELGAGYGRWLVRAYQVLRLKKEYYTVFLTAVEPEPQHFKWISQHFTDNQINPKHHTLIQAAISDSNGVRKLLTNDKPEEWYGQALSSHGNLEVPTVTISDLLKSGGDEIVDLLDMDIQGEELKALSHSAREVDRYVKLIHIGTHSSGIEEGLRKLFIQMGWRCRFDYRCGMTEETGYGAVNFQDGVQSWENPKL